MKSIGLGPCWDGKSLRASSPVMTAVCCICLGAYSLFVAPLAGALEPPGDLPAELQDALNKAGDAAEDLEYLEAATILEGISVADHEAATRTYLYSMLALYHAKAFEFGEEDDSAALEYLVQVFAIEATAVLPEEFSTTFSSLADRARQVAERRAAAANTPPHFTKIPASVTARAGRKLSLDIRAADADDDRLVLSCRSVPGAEFVDDSDGTGKFTYTPAVEAVGRSIEAWFFVADGRLKDSALVVIDIGEAAVLKPSRVVRSMLAPGWGQYSSGRKGIGAALFVGQLAALGASLVFTSSYNSSVNDYNAALMRYQNATEADEMLAAWKAAQDEYNSVSDAESMRNIAYIAAAAVYVVNLADAVLTKPQNSPAAAQTHTVAPEKIWQPEIKLGLNRVSFCWKW